MSKGKSEGVTPLQERKAMGLKARQSCHKAHRCSEHREKH